MMKLLVALSFVTMAVMLLGTDFATAQQAPGPDGPPSFYRGMPYGQFCPGRGRGPYGGRRAIRTADEARQLVENYFSSMGQNVTIGRMVERPFFYFVEILNADGVLIDKAIIDKRTGRIRSIY